LIFGPRAERQFPGLVSEWKRTFDQFFRSLQIPERLSTPFWASLAGSGFWASGPRAGAPGSKNGPSPKAFWALSGKVCAADIGFDKFGSIQISFDKICASEIRSA
jgi:hypothetical protein